MAADTVIGPDDLVEQVREKQSENVDELDAIRMTVNDVLEAT